MRLQPGHAIRLFDEATRPAKLKRHICVCPDRRLFLRINSQPLWQPHVCIEPAMCPGIVDRTSYVELRNLYRHPQSSLDRDLGRPDNPLGMIPDWVAKKIASAADAAVTLSDEQKTIIRERFGAA